MKLLNLVQGSDEWLEARLNYFCASEAPAMMGDSKFMSRNQLLDLKKGWKTNPDSKFKKMLFEKGHVHEDQARIITELEEMADFPPAVGLQIINYKSVDLELLSSFDGLANDGDRVEIWEHKDWNLTLAENVRNGFLEDHYIWQLEHQMLVSDLNVVVFTCSDGTEENRVSMAYVSSPERQNALLDGWVQFQKDLDLHNLTPKKEVIKPAAQNYLPKLSFKVNGSEIQSNIDIYLDEITELAEEEINKTLETDQDFANKDQLNKDVKAARKALKETVENIKGEFVSFSEFSDASEKIDSILQKMQSHGEKQVKEAKDKKKQDIKIKAQNLLSDYVIECDNKITPMMLGSIMDTSLPNFDAAMKGKRTIDSLQSAVDDEVATYKIKIDSAMSLIVPNLAYLVENASEYKFLFGDAQGLVNQSEEAFQAIVKGRISEHKQAEQKKLEDERARIQKEEEEKAAKKLEEDRKKIREEERLKAEAEQQAQQPEPDPLQESEYKKLAESDVVKHETSPVNYDETVVDIVINGESIPVSGFADADIDPFKGDENLFASAKRPYNELEIAARCGGMISSDGVYLGVPNKRPTLRGDLSSWADRCELVCGEREEMESILSKYGY